ncbi:MAG: TetR/AcrR family transcriptional regulator [Acidimicrobiales bacterium]
MSKPTTRPRVRRPEQRRRELIDAATTLFADRGVTPVSVADIASKAGAAVGTFYRFFDTKEGVLSAVRSDALEELRTRAADQASKHLNDDWWVGADAMTAAMVSFFFEDRERAKVVLNLAPEEGYAAEEELLRLFAAGIHIGQQVGAVGDVDPAFAASFILHAAFGLIYHAICDSPGMSRAALTRQLHHHTRKLMQT